MTGRSRTVLALAVLLFAAAGLSAARQDPPQGPVIGLKYRSLQPGEAIVATLGNGNGVRRAVFHFRGRDYELDNSAAAGQALVFIGLDLGLPPGTYPLTVTVERTVGAKKILQKDIVVEAKEFPSKKLWVKENFAVPPKAVEERIAREAELVSAVYSRLTPQWLGRGDFMLPHEGKAFLNFGQRRIYNNKPRSTHGGVDIAAPMGAPIRAANAGKVVLASDLYLSGRTVIIDHGLGVFSIYGHMSKILVKRGADVSKGDVLGKVGSTGRSTGPHLHWAVRIYDARVDPFSLLGLRLGEQ
jgi:murein DD-endopeptidase MepM/ murein hydrolase activator NlpD